MSSNFSKLMRILHSKQSIKLDSITNPKLRKIFSQYVSPDGTFLFGPGNPKDDNNWQDYSELYTEYAAAVRYSDHTEHFDSVEYADIGGDTSHADAAEYIKEPHDGFPDPDNRRAIRDWWLRILATRWQYSLFGIFLVLDSDKEVIRYLTDYGRELDQITGQDCCVFALGKTRIRRSGIDEHFEEHRWSEYVKQHVKDGLSIKVANLLKIDYNNFPCLVLFRDIRTKDYLTVRLGDMNAEKIAEQMRAIFSVAHNAIAQKSAPLVAVKEYEIKKAALSKGKAVAGEVANFTGKTLEKVMEALVSAMIK